MAKRAGTPRSPDSCPSADPTLRRASSRPYSAQQAGCRNRTPRNPVWRPVANSRTRRRPTTPCPSGSSKPTAHGRGACAERETPGRPSAHRPGRGIAPRVTRRSVGRGNGTRTCLPGEPEVCTKSRERAQARHRPSEPPHESDSVTTPRAGGVLTNSPPCSEQHIRGLTPDGLHTDSALLAHPICPVRDKVGVMIGARPRPQPDRRQADRSPPTRRLRPHHRPPGTGCPWISDTARSSLAWIRPAGRTLGERPCRRPARRAFLEAASSPRRPTPTTAVVHQASDLGQRPPRVSPRGDCPRSATELGQPLN